MDYYSNSVGLDFLDTIPNPTELLSNILFENFFKDVISPSEREDYVMYIVCKPTMAIQYILGNDKRFVTHRKNCQVRITPKPLDIALDNKKLNTGARA